MLVSVPRLITAYYTEAPDPAVPAQRVAFGTGNICKIYAGSFQGENHLHRILEEARTIINAALAASPPKPGSPSKPKRKKKP